MCSAVFVATLVIYKLNISCMCGDYLNTYILNVIVIVILVYFPCQTLKVVLARWPVGHYVMSENSEYL